MSGTKKYGCGSFSVDNSGGASYSIPILLPPGIHGMEPRLSLNYNSGRGLDMLGVGWTLTGIPRIERVPGTLAQDGVPSPVSFTADDCYSLGGSRLMRLRVGSTDTFSQGAYSIFGVGLGGMRVTKTPIYGDVYRHEAENGQVIVPIPGSDADGGPLGWTVYSPDGTVMEFGTTEDSRFRISGSNRAIRQWALNRVTDLCGNAYTCTYVRHNSYTAVNGDLYYGYTLSNIVYGDAICPRGIDFVSAAPNPDAPRLYQGGIGFCEPRLLTKVCPYVVPKAGARAESCETWSFVYELSPDTGRNRLLKIQAPTGEIAMKYQPSSCAELLGKQAPLIGVTASPGDTIIPVDLDGNGLVDLMVVNEQSLTLYQNLDGLNFQQVLQWRSPSSDASISVSNIVIFDFDGDGALEYLIQLSSGRDRLITNPNVGTMLKPVNTNGSWSLRVTAVDDLGALTTGTKTSYQNIVAMDTVGKGVMDLVNCQGNNGAACLQVMESDGRTLTSRTSNLVSLFPGRKTQGQGFWLPMDVTGDGVTDLVFIQHQGADGTDTSVATLDVAVSTCGGSPRFVQTGIPSDALPNPTNSPAQVAAGPYLFAPFVGDINGDGLQDIVWVQYDRTSIRIWRMINTGNGRFQRMDVTPKIIQLDGIVPEASASVPRIQVALVDVDGDGVAELVVTGAAQFNPGTQNTICKVIRLTGEAPLTLRSELIATQALSGVTKYTMVDMLGTGKAGVLYNSCSRNQGNPTVFPGPLMYVSTPNGQPDLLIGVKDELGVSVVVDYGPLTARWVHTAKSSARWIPAEVLPQRTMKNLPSAPDRMTAAGAGNRDVAGTMASIRAFNYPKYVVVSYTPDLVKSVASTYPAPRFRYQYSGARYDTTGRGWLGFDSIQITRSDGGAITDTSYSQVYPWVGAVLCTSKQSPWINSNPGFLLMDAWSAFSANKLSADMPTYIVTQSTHEERLYGADCKTVTERQRTELTYDIFGSNTLTVETGFQVVNGTEKQITQLRKTIGVQYQNRAMQGARQGVPMALPLVPNWTQWVTNETVLVTANAGDGTLLRSRKFRYDSRGLAISQDDSVTEIPLLTRSGYDVYGNCTSVISPAGGDSYTEYQPDLHSFPVTTTSATPINGAARLVSRFEYDAKTGMMTKSIDPRGQVTDMTIDRLGRLTRVCGPGRTVRDVGVVLKTISYDITNGYNITTRDAVDWNNNFSCHVDSYDSMGNCVGRQENLLGDESQLWATARFEKRTISIDGRVLEGTFPTTNPQVGMHYKIEYDAWGRKVKETARDDSDSLLREQSDTWLSSYQCRDISGNVTLYATFNGQRQAVCRTTAGGETTRWQYDALGRLTTIFDPANVMTSIGLDSSDRVIWRTITGADGRVVLAESTVYDDIACTENQKDAEGNKLLRVRDKLGRIFSEEATGVHPVSTQYVWDVSTPGLLNEARGLHGSYVYQYDPRGKQTDVVQRVRTMDAHFQRTYMPDGQLEKEIFPNHSVQTNTYANGRLRSTALVDAAGGVLASLGFRVSFDGTDTLLEEWFGGMQNAQHRLDALGRVVTSPTQSKIVYSSKQTEDPIRIDNGRQSSIEAVYDANSRFLRSDTAATGISTSSMIFAKTELVTLNGTRDGVVNTASFSTSNHQVTNLTNKRNSSTDLVGSFEYNANGGMVAANWSPPGLPDWRQRFEYDAMGRLYLVTNQATDVQAGQQGIPNLTMLATYDHTGRRIMKAISGFVPSRDYFLYSFMPNYEQVVMNGANAGDSAGARQTTIYLSGLRGIVGQVTDVEMPAAFAGRRLQAGTQFFVKDHLGSIIGLKGEAKRVTYGPYGAMENSPGTELASRRLFTGQEYDEEIGCHYFQSRYYHPLLARFMQADDQPGGSFDQTDVYNPYAYCLNRPYSFTDPTGHGILDFIPIFGVLLPLYWEGLQAIPPILMQGAQIGASVGLIVVGSMVTPFCAPIGGMLIGGGVGGLVYNVTTLATGGTSDWAEWGIQVGIGAATGLITAGVASAAGSMAQGISSTVTRIALQSVMGAYGGGVAGVGAQVLSNVAHGTDWQANLALALATGAAAGAVAAGAGAALGEIARAAGGASKSAVTATSFDFGKQEGKSFALAMGKAVGKSTYYSLTARPWS